MRRLTVVPLLALATACAETAAPLPPLAPPSAMTRTLVLGATVYEMVDLGTLGGNYGFGSAINDDGQVVGESEDASHRRRAFRWEDGVMTDLGTLGGSVSQVFAINSSGSAVGYGRLPGDATFHATLWNGSAVVDLGTLPGDTRSEALDINDGGQVIGRSSGSDLFDHGFVWYDGTMKELPPLGTGSARPAAINSSGEIVGTSDFGSGSGVAVLWRNEVPTNLGTLGGHSSGAIDINDAGQVAGFSETFPGSFDHHAFRWEDGVMTDLGTLGRSSSAFSMNSGGHVVGVSVTDDGWPRGFVWRDGTMTDIGVLPGGDWSAAVDVNDAGQVLAVGGDMDGRQHVFLWEDGEVTVLPGMGGNSGIFSRRAINNHGWIVGWSETADGQTRPVLWRPAAEAVLTVAIDIKPGGTPNAVNPSARGVIPVAILGSATFDASTVDAQTVTFGPGNASEVHGKGHLEDANGDGVIDMVLHFDTRTAQIACGMTTASLTGTTTSGQQIEGSDTIVTRGCR